MALGVPLMKKQRNKSDSPKPSKGFLLAATVVTLTVILISSAIYMFTRPTASQMSRAAIIDQLASSQLSPSSRHENTSFIQAARTFLLERFSQVDYYSDNATVDQYRSLPTRGYKFILWRTHSALALSSNYVAIFTSEKYGTKNYDQYLGNGLLTLCNITDDPNLYFGITPKFIREGMSGRFEDTVIVFMSCNGLRDGYLGTADVFMERGAKTFISWDGWIGFSDNDAGMSILLQHLVDGNETIREAVRSVPTYASNLGTNTLHYYPFEVADYRIPDYRQEHESTAYLIVAWWPRAKTNWTGRLL
jgi:hypothetical protein